MPDGEDIKLKFTSEYDGDKTKEAAQDIEGIKDDVGALDELLNNAASFEEAFQANDVDGARKALERLRKSLERMAKETGNETNPELRELRDQLDEAEEKMRELGEETKRTGGDLEDLSEKAEQGGESLKRIEALEVASALRESIESARSAGREFASMGDDSKGAGEKILGAVSAATAFASAARAAQAAMGPWGIALVAVTTTIQLSTEAFQEHRNKVLEAVDDEIDALNKARSAARLKKQADKEAANQVKSLTDSIKKQQEAIDDEKSAIDRRFDSLKKELELQEELTKVKLEGARIGIEVDRDAGKISSEDAEKRLANIDSIERELERDTRQQIIQEQILTTREKRLKNEQRTTQIYEELLPFFEEDLESARELAKTGRLRQQQADQLLLKAKELIQGLPGVENVEGDFINDPSRFLRDARAAVENDQNGFFRKNIKPGLPFVNPVELEQEKAAELTKLTDAEKLIARFEEVDRRAKQLLSRASVDEKAANQAISELSKEAGGLQTKNKGLTNKEQSLELELENQNRRDQANEALDALRSKNKELGKVLEKTGDDLQKGLETIESGTDEAKELAGTTAKQVGQSRDNVEEAIKALKEVLADKRVDASELGQFNQALRTVRQAVSGTNREVINALKAMRDDAKEQRNEITRLRREIQIHQEVLSGQ